MSYKSAAFVGFAIIIGGFSWAGTKGSPALFGLTPPKPIEFVGQSQANLLDRIHKAGFICPEIKEATDDGIRPLGQTVTVQCGPTLIYKAVIRPSGEVLIIPRS